MEKITAPRQYRAVVGLGNPGPRFELTRHNIGFYVVEALAEMSGARWKTEGNLEYAQVSREGIGNIFLIKPQTFMNDSGKIAAWLSRKGISGEAILVVHDELEKAFGTVSVRLGGSARGHNGLRSLLAHVTGDFWRVRVGIGRPEHKTEVADYVLQKFTPEEQKELAAIAHRVAREIGFAD